MVSGSKTSKLVRFKNGALWYMTACGFEFPIPTADITGEAELLPVEKSMALMKWIRKHLELIKQSKDAEHEAVRMPE
jgi:hypothetical protein